MYLAYLSRFSLRFPALLGRFRALPANGVCLVVLLGAVGCDRTGAVRARAAFDLNCPEEKIEVVTISSYDATFGARGCGKRGTYKWGTDIGGAVLNSPISTDGAPSVAPSASAAPAPK